MMKVAIKTNLDNIPSLCRNCPYYEKPLKHCKVNMYPSRVYNPGERPDWCPLIFVPEKVVGEVSQE